MQSMPANMLKLIVQLSGHVKEAMKMTFVII